MKEEIKKIFSGDVEDSDEVLKAYSKDASIFEVRPKLVLFPKDSRDVQNLVKWVGENKDKYADPEKNKDWVNLSITARCAGTDMSGAAIGESLVLDFTRYMNKLISFEGDTITVEPGMFYRDFEKITLEKGMILPCYTASKNLNAMGGMFGNNSAGEKTLKYGKTEDYVMASKVVFSDGKEYEVKPLSLNELNKKASQGNLEGGIYKNIYNLIKGNVEEIKKAKPNVHKNSAGYYIWNVVGSEQTEEFFNLNKLLVGSQGTLSIATEITFKLVPNQKNSKLVAIFMNDIEPLGRLVEEILELNPETIEAYDDKTMKLAVRFFPDLLRNKGFIKMAKLMWSFLPEFFMLLRGGFPKMIILVEFSGYSAKEVDEQCIKLKEKIKNFKLEVHITKSETEAEKYWDIRRESFNLLRNHIKGLRTAPFIDDIVVLPKFLPKFFPELNKVLKEYKLTYTIAGHVGDGNFHIIPLMDFKKPETSRVIMELSDKVYDLVARYHGSITAEHNDGIIRTPYLNKMYSKRMIEIFSEIKNIFDPKNVFNPGKKVGGSKEYILSHIAKEHHAKHGV